MLKSILDLDGVQKLSKDQQQKTQGGILLVVCFSECGPTGGIIKRTINGQTICICR